MTDSPSLYMYCLNDPVNAIDLWGLYTVIIPGIGSYDPGYSGELGRSLTRKGETIKEVFWSGNLTDAKVYSLAAEAISEAANIAKSRGENLNIIGYSWGSVAAGEVLNATGIRADNFITLGSPYTDYSNVSANHVNFWSPFDPMSWGSAWQGITNPNQYEIYGGIPHINYWDNSAVVKKITEMIKTPKRQKMKK